MNVAPGCVDAVAASLTEVDEFIAVVLAMGNPDIVVHAHTVDMASLQTLIDSRLAPIPDILSYETITATQLLLLDNRYGILDTSS